MNTRYKTFDWLRGLAIVAVILIHITAPLALDGDISSIIVNQITRFGVPVFIFLSGWGLTITESYSKEVDYIQFLKYQISKILPGYLIWNVIYFAYQWFIEIDRIPVNQFIKGLFFGTNFPHLYFVPLIILYYLFYPIFLKVSKYKIGVLFALILTIVSQWGTWVTPIESFTRDQNPLNWLFYFVFGIWIATHFKKYQNKIKKHKKLILVLTGIITVFIIVEPFLYLEWETVGQMILLQTRPSVIMYSVLVIFWMSSVSVKSFKIKKYLNYLSSDSFSLYLSHYLFARILRQLYLEVDLRISSVFYIILMFLFVLLLSYSLIFIQKKARKFIKQLLKIVNSLI